MIAVIDAHLDECASCASLVAALASMQNETYVDGTRIGRYAIDGVVGRGAMGVVYSARDPRLDRRVALKLVGWLPASDERVRMRMLREARAMAQLSHPNVVTIYEVDEHEADLYLAMELVHGSTLRQWLRSEPSVERVLAALLQAGEGLAAAHAAGIVHRDFKPENVIVGDDGRARVTDFGLSRPDEQAGETVEPAHLDLTRHGALLGTPLYMAPEQLAGEPADARADQFAFAVTVWEALAGSRPFRGESVAELREAITRGVPARPSTMPSAIHAVLKRSLAASPADRYPSMRVLLDALGRSRPPRGRALVAVLLGAIAVAIASGIAMRRDAPDPCASAHDEARAVWSSERGARIRARFAAVAPFGAAVAEVVVPTLDGAIARWATAREDACRATWERGAQSEAMLDARMACMASELAGIDRLASRFEQADADVVRRAPDALAELGGLDACADVVSLGAIEPRPHEPARVAELERIDRELVALRAEVAAGRHAAVREAAIALAADAQRAGYAPLVARAELLVSRIARRTGDGAKAIESAREAAVRAEGARDDRAAARAWLELLAAQGERAQWAELDATSRHAEASIRRIGDPADLRVSLAYLRGVAALQRGRLDDADRELATAEEVLAAASGSTEHPTSGAELARVLTARGNVARERGRLDDALAIHERARALDAARLGGSHPDLARHDHNIGGVLRRMGRLDDARTRYQRALELETLGDGAESPAAGLTHNSLGIVAIESGDLESARRELELADRILAAHPDHALVETNLELLAARERPEPPSPRHSRPRTPAQDVAVRSRPERGSDAAPAVPVPRPDMRPDPEQIPAYGAAQSWDTDP